MLRDLSHPPEEVLEEADIRPGAAVLDFGCGPGSYTFAAASMVGEKGKLYALDINPLAVQRVRNLAARKKRANIEAILSDGATGLPDGSLDVVLLYDTFHELEKPEQVLRELHRVLKPAGILSFNDHHLKEEGELLARVTAGGLFTLSRKGKRVYNFARVS